MDAAAERICGFLRRCSRWPLAVDGAAKMAEVYISSSLAEHFTEEQLLEWAWTVEGDLHRQMKGRCTLRTHVDGRAYFLKRHLGVGWGEILKNLVVGKKAVLGAENEYRACLHLARHDVLAPRAAAFAIERGNPARRRSFVLCGELAGFDSLEDLTDGWADAPPNPLAKRRLVMAVAHFVRRLHEIGLVHRDLYICHLLINREKWAAEEVEPAVLDLHRARLQLPVSPFWRRRDLAALLFSTQHLNLSRFSQLRFVRIYTGRPLRTTFQRNSKFWHGVERRAKALHRKAQRQAANQAASSTIAAKGSRRYGLQPPCTLVCAGAAFRIDRVFRWLPGRRLTAGTCWRGRQVVLKLFLGRGHRRCCARERRGAQRLASSGAATPQLLAELAAPEVGGRALLFECLPDARPIASLAGPQLAQAAALAVQGLAQLHERGLTHGDMHHHNFMLCRDKVYLIDGDSVAPLRTRSEPTSLKALALFLAEFAPSEDNSVPELLACYEKTRGWLDDPSRLARVRHWLAAARRRRIRRYLAKTERNCTEFAVRNDGGHRCISKRNWAWSERLAQSGGSLSQALESALAGAEIIKDGNSAKVFRLELAGEPVVVKRYRSKGPIHRFRRWFKPRPRIAWRNGQALNLLRIPTAEPLALVERRWGPGAAECHLVMRDLGALDLAAETRAFGWRPGRLEQIANLFLQLAAAGLTHGDAKATNFLIHNDQVHLIDLDSLSVGPNLNVDLHRFLDNFEGVLRRDAEAKFVEAGLLDAERRPRR